MELQYLSHLVSFLLGLASMAYFHNVFVSIFLYKSGHPNVNVSNMLKIIFNLSGVSRSVITYVTIMVVAQCPLLNDLNALSNFFYRSSLSAFLLWRLKQIEYSTWDRWISFGLFFIRTILNILAISIFRYPSTLAGGIEISCKIVNEKSTFFQLGFICLDFIIDIFVTIRLVQILNDGNRNSAEVTSIIGRDNSPSRRTSLFTAVLYWNFLRLVIDFLYNGITVLTLFNHEINIIIIESLLCFVTISQSYLITVDAEIVKVIEGRNLNEFNQNELDWLNRDGNGIIGNNINNLPTTVISIPSSRNQVSSRSVSSIYNRILQRTTSSNNINNISNRPRNNNTHSWFTTTTSSPTTPTSPQHNQSSNNQNSVQPNSPTRQIRRPTDTLRHTASYQLDKGKFVVVSMQRLTFFEWANMVTGHNNNNNNNNNGSNCSKCSTFTNNNNSSPTTPIIEEIPDVPPLPIQLQDQRQFNQPHRQFTQPQRQHTNQYHQRQISQDDSEALLPSLAYIPQSRRGSNTSIMTNSTSQTKTNNDNPTDTFNKHSFI
ncbi:hypothetical protein RhiirA1_530873 [Rhizophagus irregularis]|uniref:Uncharacterized protein n=1 Tax=Rhizophagus irregularis TaxID=588596 RepID=A0A2N0SBD5_9GLOM|nr:hypothetical protein RhiirA1_530873 [Rhizophagus irregularis]